MKAEHRDAPDLAALSAWAPELAKTFVSLSSDIALVIDASGVIRSVAQGSGEPIAPTALEWIGRAWIDTVSGETRPKIEHLLKEVAATGIARRREVNHLVTSGTSIPVAYTAIRLGSDGPVLAVGRDLRTIAAIQQRYVESQQEMERGYWHARQAEARYQLLFQVATDAVMVVDAQTLHIIEANHAASQLFRLGADELRGRHATVGFEHHARGAVNELLGGARATGQAVEIRARLQGSTSIASVAATPFRADDAMRLLVRVRPIDTTASAGTLNKTLARLVDDTTDGVVVTDSSGRILVANPAFLSLVRVANEGEVKGRALMGWLGLADQPLAALVPRVRRDGIVRHIDSWVKPSHAPAAGVEISAALLTEGDQECIGFTIHPTLPSAPASTVIDASLRDGVERLIGQLGTLGLPALRREALALVDQQLVQQALQRCHGDAAAAALLLGVSRAGLVRLRRRSLASSGGPSTATSTDGA